jgi:hypothetical protein
MPEKPRALTGKGLHNISIFFDDFHKRLKCPLADKWCTIMNSGKSFRPKANDKKSDRPALA